MKPSDFTPEMLVVAEDFLRQTVMGKRNFLDPIENEASKGTLGGMLKAAAEACIEKGVPDEHRQILRIIIIHVFCMGLWAGVNITGKEDA